MRPPFSVVFLTVLIGIGQGIYLVTYFFIDKFSSYEIYNVPLVDIFFILTLLFIVLGLFASFFHLGRPLRAWRAASKWRSSWLSREVILLPSFGFVVFSLLYFSPVGRLQDLILFIGLLLNIALFYCTAMIYSCIKFIQEWHSPYTILNFFAIGLASGFLFVWSFLNFFVPSLSPMFTSFGLLFLSVALVIRSLMIYRSWKLRPKSSIQSAVGIDNKNIRQVSQGFTGSSFNTREFFHHKTQYFIRNVCFFYFSMAFVIPFIMIYFAVNKWFSVGVVLCHFFGTLAERWHFFAQANHPQNLYYQRAS